MAKRVQLVRHDAAGLAVFTGLLGEITVNTTSNSLVVHNGVSVAGFELARKDLNNVDAATASNAGKMTATQVIELTTATTNIATNTADIATNTADIAANTANIATNTADIATNASAIATNAANIATNTSNISTNASNIATLQGYFTVGVANLANGGTGSSSAAGARTNLGLVIGTNVQAYSSNLAAFSGKTAPTGVVVGTTDTQTLTNKTLTTPVISLISNTGTLTLPTSTDTLVGRATTDTLINKTLTSPVLNGSLSGTSFKDEDDMASDSATSVASQQSIVAYVNAQIIEKRDRYALVYNAAAQTISTATYTSLFWDTEDYDSDGLHSTVTNSDRLTVPSGVTKVRLVANVIFDNNSTGERLVRIQKNGSTSYTGFTGLIIPAVGISLVNTYMNIVSPILTVVAGDWFNVRVYQNSGGNLDVLGGGVGASFSMEIIR